MIDFDATVSKAKSFNLLEDAKKWVVTIIKDLVDLKQSPGGHSIYKRLLQQIVEPFHKKGKATYLKEIEGYIQSEEYNRQQDTFDEATKDKQRDKFDTTDKGVILANQENIVKLLSNNKFIEFQYETFTDRQIFRFIEGNVWPEGLERDILEIKYPRPHRVTGLKVNRWYYVSGHLSELKLYLHQFFPEERAWFELESAIDTVTKRNLVNIHRDWMDNGLPEWDGDEHMDFMHRHAGVTDKTWAMIIGRLMILGIVARCYDPGYDFRGNVILEGPENIGKTRLCKILPFSERYYTAFEFTKNTNNYETARQLRGRIVVELADKGGMDTRSSDQIKAFLTMTQDVNRRMRSDDVEEIKRIGIIMITCNESGAYLKGGSDDTRFYPCRCNGKIDIDAIIAELPQIYAQAKHMWDNGITPRPTDDEMKLQQRYVAPRKLHSKYYDYVLDAISLHRNQIVIEHAPWDEGFTFDEMMNWFSGEDWFILKSKQQHANEIKKVLPLFKMKSLARYVPTNISHKDAGKMTRKIRYVGEIKWDEFINGLLSFEDQNDNE